MHAGAYMRGLLPVRSNWGVLHAQWECESIHSGVRTHKLTIIYMKRKSPCPYSTNVFPSFLVLPGRTCERQELATNLKRPAWLEHDVRALAMVGAPVCGRKAGVVGHTESARLEWS